MISQQVKIVWSVLQLNKSVMLLPLFCAGTSICNAVQWVTSGPCSGWKLTLKPCPEMIHDILFICNNLFVFLSQKHPDNSFGKLARHALHILFIRLCKCPVRCSCTYLERLCSAIECRYENEVLSNRPSLSRPCWNWRGSKTSPDCNFLGAFIKYSPIQECF